MMTGWRLVLAVDAGICRVMGGGWLWAGLACCVLGLALREGDGRV